MNQSLFEQKMELDKRKREITGKLEKADERFIEGDIDKESYQRYRLKIEEQLAEIAKDEQKLAVPLSNQEKFIDFSIEMCRNLSKIWASKRLTDKIQFQKMAFPEGLRYDLDNRSYRTKRVNSVILQIAQLARVSGESEKRNSSQFEKNSAQVAPGRIELPSKVPETFVLSIKLRGH